MQSPHISGQLDLTGAKLANPGGTALTADWLAVNSSMLGREGFQAEGEVRLAGAHISGQLGFRGASLHADFTLDPLQADLTLHSLQAESLWLDDMADIGLVDLASTQVKALHDTPGGWPRQMRLDGFIYESLQPYREAKGASGWLRTGRS